MKKLNRQQLVRTIKVFEMIQSSAADIYVRPDKTAPVRVKNRKDEPHNGHRAKRNKPPS